MAVDIIRPATNSIQDRVRIAEPSVGGKKDRRATNGGGTPLVRLQTPPGTHAAAGRRRRANREDTLRALRFRLSHMQRHSIHHICIGAGAPAIQYTPRTKTGHTFTRVCPHMHRWTSSSKTAHHMPPRGSKPCFRLDSRSFQVERFTASTAGPGRSEVVGAAAWPRRSAIIGLLQADLMQVHSPQPHLTQILK